MKDAMNKTILVVDDDLDARNILRVFLTREGFDVLEATDGYDAVEKALQNHPDLVIMDMAMPVVDGVNSIRTMRQHDSLVGVPILGLTAFTDFYTPRAMEAGCTDVLHKPVDFSRLRPAVNRYLG
jgi:DNA-binding response OmpR family regulator